MKDKKDLILGAGRRVQGKRLKARSWMLDAGEKNLEIVLSRQSESSLRFAYLAVFRWQMAGKDKY